MLEKARATFLETPSKKKMAGTGLNHSRLKLNRSGRLRMSDTKATNS